MAFSIYGIGTRFYGQRDFQSDGSYITTIWLTFVFVPLVPLHSLRLRYRGAGLHGSVTMSDYKIFEKMRPNLRQVLYTYAFVLSAGAWEFLVATVMARYPSDTLASPLGLCVSIVALSIPIPIPWLLRRYAIRRVFASR